MLKLYELVYRPTFFMFSNIPDGDRKLIVKLLSEVKHGKILVDNRAENLDELIENQVGKKKWLR